MEKTEPFAIAKPRFSTAELLRELGGGGEKVPRHLHSFPEHIDKEDIEVKFAGSGGDGAQTAALLLAKAGAYEGLATTHIPSYGPESRGGTSYADVHIAFNEVLSPAVTSPHILVVFNSLSLCKFAPTVRDGGIIIYDSTVISELPKFNEGVKVYALPLTEIAQSLGKRILKNVVCLGALCAITNIFPSETFLEALQRGLKKDPRVQELNKRAFEEGFKAIEN